jgi:hypothetical protein
MNLTTRIGLALGVILLLGGFSAYLVTMLQEHGSTCDSTLRHCAVEQEEIAFLEGDWCAAVDPAALRERFVFDGDRIRVVQEGPILETAQEWREARFFASMGEIIYFEHDLQDGGRLSGEITIRPDGPDSRISVIGPRQVAWVRCATG